MSTMRSWEAKNCLVTYLMPIKPCKRLIKAKKTKKNRKKTKKTSPKFEICGSVRFFFRYFSAFFGFFRFFSVFCGTFSVFSVFCGTFSVFFGLNFDKKFQSFKNHVNNEVLGGQELPSNILNAYKALQTSYKSYN